MQGETQVYISLSRLLAACSTLTLEALNAPPPKHVLASRQCIGDSVFAALAVEQRSVTTGTGEDAIVIVRCSTSRLPPPASQGRVSLLSHAVSLVRCWAWDHSAEQPSPRAWFSVQNRHRGSIHHSMRPFSGRFDSRSKSRRLSCVFDLGATSRVLQR